MVRRILSAVFGAGCTVLAVAALAWRSADFFGRAAGYVTIGYVIAPWAALASAAAFVFALLVKKPIAAQLMMFAIIMWASSVVSLLIPRTGTPVAADSGDRLRVMSFNAWLDQTNPDPERASRVAELIRAEKPDIVLLQEVSERNLIALRADLLNLYGAESLRVTGSYSGFVVLSRFPLEPIDTDSEPTRRMRVLAQTPSGPVEVWNIHAYRENLLGGNNALTYRDLNKHRTLLEQAKWLTSRIESAETPLLMGGDFNMPLQAPAYRTLTSNLIDAHVAAGEGLGFTFPASARHLRIQPILGADLALSSPIRLTRLDHLFVNRQFDVLATRTLADSAGSDHAPIVADIRLVRRGAKGQP
jgi:vancomycin resistance protein VanJ